MTFLQQWRAKIEQNVQQLGLWLDRRRTEDLPHLVYGHLAAVSLLPIAEAMGAAAANPLLLYDILPTLGVVMGSVGSSLIANQIQRWADGVEELSEAVVAEWVQETAINNLDLRVALDNLLLHFKVVQQAQSALADERQAAFLATLQGETAVLGSSLNTIVAELQQTAAATANMSDLATYDHKRPDALNHYLKTLISRCDPIDIPAIDETFAADREQGVHISDVYTSLRLAHDQRTAVGMVEATMRLVVLGVPGGGKSTLVNYLTAELAKRYLGRGDKLSLWVKRAPLSMVKQKLLPVRIILRRFAAWLPAQTPIDKAGLVWGYLEKQLSDMGCSDLFPVMQRTLRQDGGILFFDGLDEVRETDADKKRTLIKEAIVAFSEPIEKCQIVVTCREYAYKQDDAWRLPVDRFPQVELALFSPEQIGEFTTLWYQMVGPSKGWDAAKIGYEAALLADAATNTPYLLELARYPLLLTLMAQVHGRDGTLPENRADLYERAVNLLLSHWESRIERDIGLPIQSGLIAQLGVRRELLKSALAQVALAAHERQEHDPQRNDRAADVLREDLRDVLRRELNSLDRAETVIDYIQQRAGLLQARDGRTFTFPHRSFQEYLAATAIWEEEEPAELLRQHVQRDAVWWREVFLLAAGKERAKPHSVATLIDVLLPAPSYAPLTVETVEWARIAGQAVRETDYVEFVARREGTDNGGGRLTRTLHLVRDWLERSMLAGGQLSIHVQASAGRALGRLTYADGRPLDRRAGVGFHIVGRQKVPDIAWGEWLPAGQYQIGEGKGKQVVELVQDVRLAKYPITAAQFDCFVGAEDVEDSRWWVGMPDDERTFREQRFQYNNHPRDTISWYQAVAFCRWLSDKLDTMIELPHEYAWEVAARYSHNRSYPWGSDQFDSLQANTWTGDRIGKITAVGLYIKGKNQTLNLYDISGNVWEWCCNKYSVPVATKVDDSNDVRALRGGAWILDHDSARTACRYNYHPNYRGSLIGIRVCMRRISSQGR